MKYLTITFACLTMVFMAAFCITSAEKDCLKYENSELKSMVNSVMDYVDSTADTGQMDDFVSSKEGKYFIDMYGAIYN